MPESFDGVRSEGVGGRLVIYVEDKDVDGVFGILTDLLVEHGSGGEWAGDEADATEPAE